ncbi:MAG: ABC transporter permease [Lachnospiraceae bacterium]|nr:ABC transporter permease [Lachnospiraceae bacterium]
MSKLFTVIGYEIKDYLQNKSFIIMTILLTVVLFGGSFLPRVFDLSSMTGVEKDSSKSDDSDDSDDSEEADDSIAEEDLQLVVYLDEGNVVASEDTLKEFFPDCKFEKADSMDSIKKDVKSGKAAKGFYFKDNLHYEYIVLNSEMFDETEAMLEAYVTNSYKQQCLSSLGVDASSFVEQYEQIPEGKTTIMGKDASQNYWYCYILVIVIFMLIILYGVMIATSVTNEKSNRSIEVLVTSIDSTHLLFGKVFAGTIAVVIQVGVVMAAALIGYSINHDAWGNKLDMFLDIPANVLAGFIVFGVGGFIFYAFIYGALGALVSKTEDINKVAGSAQMIIMIVYFLVLLNLQSPDGAIMKVCSYLPISSYSAMFVRIAMGSVTRFEIVISAVVLFASTILVGWLAAKIYRMGTLRYGNPIKVSNALKLIKNQD